MFNVSAIQTNYNSDAEMLAALADNRVYTFGDKTFNGAIAIHGMSDLPAPDVQTEVYRECAMTRTAAILVTARVYSEGTKVGTALGVIAPDMYTPESQLTPATVATLNRLARILGYEYNDSPAWVVIGDMSKPESDIRSKLAAWRLKLNGNFSYEDHDWAVGYDTDVDVSDLGGIAHGVRETYKVGVPTMWWTDGSYSSRYVFLKNVDWQTDDENSDDVIRALTNIHNDDIQTLTGVGEGSIEAAAAAAANTAVAQEVIDRNAAIASEADLRKAADASLAAAFESIPVFGNKVIDVVNSTLAERAATGYIPRP